MFESALVVYVIVALILILASGSGRLILHLMYGPDLPSGVQSLAADFRSLQFLGINFLIEPFKFIRRILLDASENDRSERHTSITPPDMPRLPEQ